MPESGVSMLFRNYLSTLFVSLYMASIMRTKYRASDSSDYPAVIVGNSLEEISV